MKRILAVLLAFGLIAGLALAQDVNVGEEFATVTQDITVIIPLRAALHITEAEWTLDLDDVDAIGEYCWFISKNEYAANPTLSTELQVFLGSFGPKLGEPAVGFGYPPIRPNRYPITDDDKGYLVCEFEKVIQKFANSGDGWELEISLAGAPLGGFGVFAFTDYIPDLLNNLGKQTIVANGSILETFTWTTGTTGGWLDDYITEGFFFDGSEVAGTYELEFIVTLTNL
jgi:hypothetical protein